LKNQRANLEGLFLMLCIVGGIVSTFMFASAFNLIYNGFLFNLPPIDPLQAGSNQLGNSFGTDYRVYYTNKSLPIETVLEEWQSEIANMKSFGFNTVRLSFAFNNSGGTTHSTLVYSELNQVLTLLDENGLHAVLDLHNWEDMQGFFGSPDWIQSWVDLASHYKNDQTIIAYELFNEPYPSTWYSTVQTGGAGGPEGTGCLQALAQCVDAIRATGDQHAIVYPDPYFIIPSSQITNPNYIPASLKRTNIIITFHCWYGDNQTMNTMNADLVGKEQEVTDWQKYYTVWIGEYGWYTGPAYNQTIQQAWLVGWTKFAIQNGIRVSWWLHGYTGGRTQAYQLCKMVMQDAGMSVPVQATTSASPYDTH